MISDKELLELEALLREDEIYEANISFWNYCKLVAPDFYKEDREYLKEMCNDLQEFYEDDKHDALIMNLPPRHGKSRTATLFVQWCLGKDNNNKIMTGSYNEDLSTMFSKQVRDKIVEEKADSNIIVYNEIFPGTKIKRGDAAAKKWSLEGQSNNNYLATSPGGTATGFGADIMIIDDVIKSAYEANNKIILEKQWDWFTNTMLSRLQGKRKIILIMTRWSTHDLAGKALSFFEDAGFRTRSIIMKAWDGEKMLCDDVLNKQQFDVLSEMIGEDILSANYNQIPIDLKGALYKTFLTYKEAPEFIQIMNYTDTADKGNDYLCSITFGIYNNKAYILDIYYTQDPMEVTEVELAKRLLKYKVNICRIESNNGGRGFSRNVERLTRELGNNHTSFIPFTQTKNKEARILTGASGVMQNIYYPEDWKKLYKEYYTDITSYQRIGKNEHDDAPDALTGVYEQLDNNSWGW